MAALSTVWASAAWTTVEMLATWWVRKALGNARPSPYCVRSVAPGSRVCFALCGSLDYMYHQLVVTSLAVWCVRTS